MGKTESVLLFCNFFTPQSESWTNTVVIMVNKSFSVANKILTDLRRNNNVLDVIVNVAGHS